MSEIEKKLFNKYGVVENKPCKFKLGCGHAIPCAQCRRPLILPTITDTKIMKMFDIINRYYILCVEKFTESTMVTAHLIPDENLMVDEAYFTLNITQPNLSLSVCELITKIYDDLTEEEHLEVKQLLEAF